MERRRDDLVIHLALWFVALGLEIWCCLEKNRGHEMLQELQTTSLWALIVAVGGIAVAQLFAMWAGGQDAGKLFPTTYGVIVGGAYASITFAIGWWQMVHFLLLDSAMARSRQRGCTLALHTHSDVSTSVVGSWQM